MDSNTYETLRSPHANQRACTLLLILEGNACIFQQGNRELKHHLNSTRNNRSELDINMNFQSNRSDVMTYPSEGSCYSIFSIICMLCRSCFVLLYFFLFGQSVLLRYTDSDYPFGIFKLFTSHPPNSVFCSKWRRPISECSWAQ